MRYPIKQTAMPDGVGAMDIRRVPFWHQPTPELSAAAECETAEFIAALVQLVKPAITVECGAYQGDTSAVLAHAARDYGGVVYAVENDEVLAGRLVQRAIRESLDNLRVVHASCAAWEPPAPADIVFVDCGSHVNRLATLALYLRMKTRWILVHDCVEWYGMRVAVREVVRQARRSIFYAETPCGLGVVGPEL